MKSQKHLFRLPEGLHYLNCAYKAPLLIEGENAAIKSLMRSRNPTQISPADFFSESKKVRKEYAKIIHTSDKNVAIIPSTSYGFSTLFLNIEGKPNGKAIAISSEFPSGYFALQKWCSQHSQKLEIVEGDERLNQIGQDWNERLLTAIDETTSVVCMSAIHWSTGLKYDLEAIGAKCREVKAKFLIDGAQTIGALPVDVNKCHIDGLVCASYKCLHGPYSMCMLYVHDDFFGGQALEEAWMNRAEAENFSALSDYNMEYQEGAFRYNMGQTSNFILTPILLNGLRQINSWGVENIQNYCKELALPFISKMKALGYIFEEEPYICYHLFSVKIGIENVDRMKEIFTEKNLSLSIRGAYLRISLNVYNEAKDLNVLGQALALLATETQRKISKA